VSGKRGEFSVGHVDQVGQPEELQFAFLKGQGQRALGVKRDVSVAWAGIPPVQAKLLERRGFGEGLRRLHGPGVLRRRQVRLWESEFPWSYASGEQIPLRNEMSIFGEG
jgi:hypothetical protein